MKKNGFTLVELLAVIVILAIIMIIAIPAVLETMQTAKKKSLLEFAQKAMNKAEEKYLAKMTMGDSYPLYNGQTNIVFDVKKDLGLSSTGSYYGIVEVVVGDDYHSTSAVIADGDNSLFFEGYDPANNKKAELSLDYVFTDYLSQAIKGKGLKVDDINLKEILEYPEKVTQCNWMETTVVDAATGNKIYYNTSHQSKYASDANGLKSCQVSQDLIGFLMTALDKVNAGQSLTD